ncbi:MAG: hypothetical protein NVSMB18_07310 [Acetobacteraceae bacterium]
MAVSVDPRAPSQSRALVVVLRRAMFGVGLLAIARAMLRRAARADPERRFAYDGKRGSDRVQLRRAHGKSRLR